MSSQRTRRERMYGVTDLRTSRSAASPTRTKSLRAMTNSRPDNPLKVNSSRASYLPRPPWQNNIGMVTSDPGVSDVFARQIALKLRMDGQVGMLVLGKTAILYLQAGVVWDASSHPCSDKCDMCFGG